MPDDVIQDALGGSISGTPDGLKVEDLGTNCIWNADDGSSVKVEFNVLSFDTQKDLFSFGGDDFDEISIGGQDAFTYTTGGTTRARRWSSSAVATRSRCTSRRRRSRALFAVADAALDGLDDL